MWYFIGGLAAGVMLFAAETMLAKIRGMKEGQRLLLEENERLHTQNRTLEDELAAWKKAAAEYGLTEDGKTFYQWAQKSGIEVLSQMPEEFFTSVFKLIISGDINSYNMYVAYYRGRGYSEEEAEKMASKKVWQSLLWDFATGTNTDAASDVIIDLAKSSWG